MIEKYTLCRIILILGMMALLVLSPLAVFAQQEATPEVTEAISTPSPVSGTATVAGTPTLDPQATFFAPEDEDNSGNSIGMIVFMVGIFLVCFALVTEAIVKYIIKAKDRYDDNFK